MITLPKKASEPTVISPKTIVIYGKPKVGKTSCLVALPDSLLIDLERGSNSYKGVKIDVLSEAEKNNITVINYLYKLSVEIKKEKPYKFLIFDTITSLEDHCKSYALKLYQETPMGAKYTGDILSLPNGGG